MVWRRPKEMPREHKGLLSACEKFLKEHKIPDPRLAVDCGDRYLLRFGKPIKDERVVMLWAKDQNRPLAHVAFTMGGTAKRLMVWDEEWICYQLVNVPEMDKDSVAEFWVDVPPDVPMR